MPLETAPFVNDLVSTNPASSDQVSQGDDHIRLLKAVLLATFPNLDDEVSATPEELNQLASGTRTLGLANGGATSPSLYFDSEATLGLYRASAGHLSVSQGKRLAGNGTTTCGAVVMFPKVPSGFSNGGTAGTNTEWLECDGSVYNVADFPDLGAFLGSTFGGNGSTTFGVPNMWTDQRFPRSRNGSLAVGTTQSDAVLAHTHTATVTEPSAGAHTHTVDITDPGHLHGFDFNLGVQSSVGGLERPQNPPSSGTYNTRSATTGISAATQSSGAHTHGTTVAVSTDGDTENRPNAFVFIFAIKT